MLIFTNENRFCDMNIDLSKLTPDDFERFVRDLLSKEYDCHVESFTIGPDQGRDLRFQNAQIIVQCKHISSWKNLLSSLKNEAVKSIVKNTKRYIVATSLGLTPNNKDEIKKILPNIKQYEDILGRDDIEGLLAKHGDIRKLYPKLWLGDRDAIEEMLASVIDKSIDNQTKIELQKIVDSLGYLAIPPQYQEATQKLEENKSIIITGSPGVGKTSLAYLIIWNILLKSKHQYEFVFISSDISEGFQKLKDNVYQIFLFDDYLGTNFLNDRLKINKDRQIASFIKYIANSSNKLALFTTREYIYQQSRFLYRGFGDGDFDYNKFIIDIGDYDIPFRAMIFYNHLWFNKVTSEAIKSIFDVNLNDIFKRKKFITILQHKSYNPRIIARVCSKSNRKIQNKEFSDNVINSLNDPVGLYSLPFKDLDNAQQLILLLLGTYPASSSIDLIIANAQEISYAGIRYAAHELKESFRILEGDFTITNVDGGIHIVDFVNPGIRDFIHWILKNNTKLLQDIIENLLSISQAKYLIEISSLKNGYIDENLKHKLVDHFINIIGKSSPKYDYCGLKTLCSKRPCPQHCRDLFLTNLILENKEDIQPDLCQNVIDNVIKNQCDVIDDENISYLFEIIENVQTWFFEKYEIDDFICTLFNESIYYTSTIEKIHNFCELSEANGVFLKNSKLDNAFSEWINSRFEEFEDYEIEQLEEEEDIFKELNSSNPEGLWGISYEGCREEIEALIERKKNEREESDESDDSSWKQGNSASNEVDYSEIEKLFRGLI